MRILYTLLLFVLCLSQYGFAADTTISDIEEKTAVSSASQEIYSCKYYKVSLPAGWKAIKSPQEEHGNVNAIFATDNESSIVTVIMGPTLGADTKTIATMFADQFQAQKPPVLKDGQYTFNFTQHGNPVNAELSTSDNTFRLITIYGDQNSARNFIDKSIIPVNDADNQEKTETIKKEEDNTEKQDADPKEESGKDEKKPDKEKEVTETPDKEKGASEKKAVDTSDKTSAKGADEEKKGPLEYSCEFYKVTLPQGWRAILPPTEEVGNINAIFADSSNAIVITIIIGPRLGADESEIASMFADQFKALDKPELKNDQYTFTFPQNGATARAIVRVDGNFFLIATTTGNEKEIRKFFKNNIKSDYYTGLIPR